MVVSAAPLASAVGARVLSEGGNAVDAAVAAAFALTVVEPSMSSIGGRTQILIRTADGALAGVDGGTEVVADFDPARMPAAPEPTMGYGTVAIPGTVAALASALESHGSWSLAEALRPAIALAEHGYTLSPLQGERMAAAAEQLALYPGTAAHFLRDDGSPWRTGDRFAQPALARTLRTLAREGARSFYAGDIARAMAADMAANDGFLTLEDLAGYRALPALVARGSYRGHDLAGTYLPASGATVIQVMQLIEAFDDRTPDFDAAAQVGSPAWVAVVARALRIGFEDRMADLGEPEAQMRLITSPAWARERAEALTFSSGTVGSAGRTGAAGIGAADRGAANLEAAGMEAAELEAAETGAREIGAVGGDAAPLCIGTGAAAGRTGVRAGADHTGIGAAAAGTWETEEPAHTTHLSVADRHGGLVALTQSIGPSFGSHVAHPELGFLYASTQGYLAAEPGIRPMSSMAPLLVFRDGEPAYVVGGAGARRIVSAMVAVLSRALDGELSLEDAMAAPRLHALDGDAVRLEERPGAAWGADAAAAVGALGESVSTSAQPMYFARLHAIYRDPDSGAFTGVADPRGPGAAVGATATTASADSGGAESARGTATSRDARKPRASTP
jgi:gamma-glutamyltranspeptidase